MRNTAVRALRSVVVVSALIAGAVGVGFSPGNSPAAAESAASTKPAEFPLTGAAAISAASVGLTVTPIVTGLTIPWDLLFTPDGTMIYNERAGGLWARRTNGATTQLSADFSDLWVSGEVGLMGMAVDPDFAGNRQIYTCQSHLNPATPGDIPQIWVVKWSINSDFTVATRLGTLVTGIMQTHNSHAGCRLRFDNNKLLYVSTGDSAEGTNPQDLTSLSGKVLRVTTAGAAAPGNPYLSSSNPNTRLIFTSGHRNPQGLSLRPGTVDEMWSVEQGTDRDDEVNRLVSGGNYGWNPRVPPATGYDQSTPMTNPNVPGALPAIFSTGFPTLALSGGAWLSGPQWGPWNGAFLAAALKASTAAILSIAPPNTLVHIDSPGELDGTFGRLRSPLEGPDGNLYLTTSNGGGTDQILRVVPHGGPGDGRCYGPRPDASTPVAAVTTGSTTTGYVIGTNGSLYARSIDGGPNFTDLGGISPYGPAAVSWDGIRTDTFVVGTDGALYHRYRATAAGAWSDWEALGGVLTSAPAAVSFANGTLAVLARGVDGAAWTLRWTGSGWTGWSSLGGRLSGGPSGVVDRDTGTGRVGVRGLSGELYELTLDAGGGATGFAATGVPVCGAPGYATRTGDGLNIRWATTDVTGATALVNGSTLTQLGGILTGTAALATPGGSGFAVLGRGTDGTLWVYDARTGAGSWRNLGGQIR